MPTATTTSAPRRPRLVTTVEPGVDHKVRMADRLAALRAGYMERFIRHHGRRALNADAQSAIEEASMAAAALEVFRADRAAGQRVGTYDIALTQGRMFKAE